MKPTYEELEAKCAALAAEKEKFAVECAATKIAIAYLKSGRHHFTLNIGRGSRKSCFMK